MPHPQTVCSFVCTSVCLFVRSFFVWSSVCMFICLYVHLFVRSSVCMFICLFGHLFVVCLGFGWYLARWAHFCCVSFLWTAMDRCTCARPPMPQGTSRSRPRPPPLKPRPQVHLSMPPSKESRPARACSRCLATANTRSCVSRQPMLWSSWLGQIGVCWTHYTCWSGSVPVYSLNSDTLTCSECLSSDVKFIFNDCISLSLSLCL